jgi:hypothetical protein
MENNQLGLKDYDKNNDNNDNSDNTCNDDDNNNNNKHKEKNNKNDNKDKSSNDDKNDRSLRNDLAVVDSKLRVRGVLNLRVADASVFPMIPSGPTSAICMAVGEAAGRFILKGRTR